MGSKHACSTQIVHLLEARLSLAATYHPYNVAMSVGRMCIGTAAQECIGALNIN